MIKRRKEFGLNDIKTIASELIKESEGNNIWLFFGDIGTGKTTIIKSICELLGVRQMVNSPTFSLINEYLSSSKKKIYHFDLYRIKNEKEIFEIGTTEYFDSEELCLVEWPKKLGMYKPTKYFQVELFHESDQKRSIEYKII